MKKSVNIIGGGVSGLVTAALLAKKGVKVSLFERLHKVGGVVDSFSRKGYFFEASTHQLGGLDVTRALYRMLGSESAPEARFDDNIFDVYYLNEEGRMREHYRVPTGAEKCLNWFISRFPEEAKQLKRYFRIIKGMTNDMDRLFRLEFSGRPLFHLYDALTALMLSKGRDGGLLKAIGEASYPYLTRYCRHNYREFMQEFAFSPRLYSLLSQNTFYLSASPEEASAVLVGGLIYGFVEKRPYLFKEGSHSFINYLKETIEQNGGEIRCNCPIERVEVSGSRVNSIYDSSGNCYSADYTVASMCSYTTFQNLIGEEHVSDKEYMENMKSTVLTDSTFSVYIGLPFSLADLGFASGSAFFNYSYDIDQSSTLRVPGPRSTQLFSNYSHFNSDPNRSSFVLLELDDYNLWKNFSYKSAEYRAFKKEREDLIISKFERATGIPVREKAELIFSSSPLTNRHYMGNGRGEVLGYKSTPEQMLNKIPPITTPFNNLYLAGQYAKPGGGVSGVLMSGMGAAKAILKR